MHLFWVWLHRYYPTILILIVSLSLMCNSGIWFMGLRIKKIYYYGETLCGENDTLKEMARLSNETTFNDVQYFLHFLLCGFSFYYMSMFCIIRNIANADNLYLQKKFFSFVLIRIFPFAMYPLTEANNFGVFREVAPLLYKSECSEHYEWIDINIRLMTGRYILNGLDFIIWLVTVLIASTHHYNPIVALNNYYHRCQRERFERERSFSRRPDFLDDPPPYDNVSLSPPRSPPPSYHLEMVGAAVLVGDDDRVDCEVEVDNETSEENGQIQKIDKVEIPEENESLMSCMEKFAVMERNLENFSDSLQQFLQKRKEPSEMAENVGFPMDEMDSLIQSLEEFDEVTNNYVGKVDEEKAKFKDGLGQVSNVGQKLLKATA